ncbi:ClpP/crotonase-like domain-containing protein [Mycena vitilis]|nr:ClpP/crotonase-like domain-containing protein [Mycena vitilis]
MIFSQLLQLFSILCSFFLSTSGARYPSFGTLQTSTSAGVMDVVINNTFSEINIFDFHVMADLANLLELLQSNGTDSDVHVVVFSSANPDFFIAHIDINLFLPGFESPLPQFDPFNPDMIFPDALMWNITQLPQATIAVIEGRARGIGNEFLMACDMRFALDSPEVLVGQLENSVGAVPGAGGALYLSNLIGRGRTLEYVLSSADVDAATAASLGWVNAVFDTSSKLHDYVRTLAERIALFPLAGIAGTKQGVNAVSRPPRDVFVRDSQNVILSLEGLPETRALDNKVFAATNNQSNGPFELNWAEAVLALYN